LDVAQIPDDFFSTFIEFDASCRRRATQQTEFRDLTNPLLRIGGVWYAGVKLEPGVSNGETPIASLECDDQALPKAWKTGDLHDLIL
jgi:hypothetical protein